MIDAFDIRIDSKATGERIRNLRMARNLKVSEMAEILHSSENAIFKWQRGECLPSVDNLVVLSILFEVHIDEIIQTEGRGNEPLLPFLFIVSIVLNCGKSFFVGLAYDIIKLCAILWSYS